MNPVFATDSAGALKNNPIIQDVKNQDLRARNIVLLVLSIILAPVTFGLSFIATGYFISNFCKKRESFKVQTVASQHIKLSFSGKEEDKNANNNPGFAPTVPPINNKKSNISEIEAASKEEGVDVDELKVSDEGAVKDKFLNDIQDQSDAWQDNKVWDKQQVAMAMSYLKFKERGKEKDECLSFFLSKLQVGENIDTHGLLKLLHKKLLFDFKCPFKKALGLHDLVRLFGSSMKDVGTRESQIVLNLYKMKKYRAAHKFLFLMSEIYRDAAIVYLFSELCKEKFLIQDTELAENFVFLIFEVKDIEKRNNILSLFAFSLKISSLNIESHSNDENFHKQCCKIASKLYDMHLFKAAQTLYAHVPEERQEKLLSEKLVVKKVHP